jgi:hypothetical protein
MPKFEQKYKISSKEFMESWTAEDLEGKDVNYPSAKDRGA